MTFYQDFGKGLLKVVQKRSAPFKVIRNESESGFYNDNGEWEKYEEVTETVRLFHVPASGKALSSLPEGERTNETFEFWSLPGLELKDRVVIDGFICTIREGRRWPGGFISGLLVRTGEKDTADAI